MRRVRPCSTKERGAVHMLWCEGGLRAAGAARVALRAQRHCSGVMIVSSSRL